MNADGITFWLAILLLFLFSLTSFREWRTACRKIYHRIVETLKFQPYLGYITDGLRKGKSHSDLSSSHDHSYLNSSGKRSIFPRSRRNTQ